MVPAGANPPAAPLTAAECAAREPELLQLVSGLLTGACLRRLTRRHLARRRR